MAIQAREAQSVSENGHQAEDTVTGTVLEGVRAKVFLDRYSLKNPEGKPIEQTPEQMWQRVARGIAAVEATPELRAYWEEQFYQALKDFRFVPGGRVLSSAGTGFETTYYNCFQGDTPVHTRAGIVPIGSLSGPHEVLSAGGVYRTAFFRSYGYQRLWEVTLANGAVFYATGDHQWVVTKPRGGTERVPTRQLLGRRIPINARPAPAYDADFAEGVRHGIVFGDGSMQYGKAHVCLFGESEVLARWFDGYSARPAGGAVATKVHVCVEGLPAAWKQLPAADASPAYWRGFVAGLIAADGHVDARGSVMLHNKDAGVLAQIADRMASAGLVASSLMLARSVSPFDGSDKPLYCLRFFKETVRAEDLLLPSHRANFERSPQARPATVQVIEVNETDRIEEVFCCVEPETHTITIGHGYLTGQCFVIPSPEDSRGGILDNLKILTEIMARGGGVGVNLSTLRPRGSYIKTVNGTASGPVSWAELYSVITGDVIQQGGSRRGALMIMLDDDHPDIVEFIHAKKIDPLTNRPVAIEHANISVAVSDAFMQAVAEDGDWPTQFPTKAMVAANPALAGTVKPGPTYRARALWRMICESAWATAEPGVVFIDRYNAWNNTWYYQTIRCTNPCGEQGLAPWNVCNLAALNLSTFVTGPLGAGTFDYEALAQFARIGLRFSDNVIDANRYFFQENADEQLGTRRTGLGTMGLADALIKLGVRYGSPESEPIIERIYRTIRDAAYDASADLAAEKGPFPRFDRDKYLQGRFIRTLPAALQAKIAKQGIRNAVILTQAPTGTTSLLAGVSSGIEPVFDFVFKRVDRTGEHIIYHPLLKQWMDEHPDQERPDYFVGANDLTPEDHIRVQAMVQRYTDSSISKTCNAPNSHTIEEVERLYRLAYESGCKGVTYYRDGSRDAVLHHIDDKKQEQKPEAAKAAAPASVIDKSIRPLPAVVHGYTRKMQAPEGKVNITLNSDEQGLLEVFVNVGRAGSDIAALAEALGRLISLIQRLPSPLTADERAQLVVNQLRGIGGSRTVGFGLEQVRSLPDAIGLALQKHLEGQVRPAPAGRADPPISQPALPGLLNGSAKMTGNLCPECGSTAFVFEEGCKKCHACGYSEC